MIQNIKGLKESIVKSLIELYTRPFQKKQSQQTRISLFFRICWEFKQELFCRDTGDLKGRTH